MTSMYLRILALSLSVVLTLPPRFCCYWSTISCCPKGQTAEAAGQKKAKACCQQACATEVKGDTSHTPPTEPPQPCKSPCCDRQPTTLVGKDSQLDHIPLPLVGEVASFVPILRDFEAAGFDEFTVASPPLQILHCCWLC